MPDNTQCVNPADLTSTGGQVQGGSSHQVEGTLGDVPMTSAPTFVAETPVGHVEGEVASQQSHNSFEELYEDAQRVSQHADDPNEIFDIDLDFDPPLVPSGDGSGSPSDPSSSGGGVLPLFDDEADRAELAALIKERDRAQLKKELHKLRAQKASGFHEEFNHVPGAKRQRLDVDAVALERAKEITKPERYSGKSQAALDTFIRACEVNFRTKPTIYALQQSRCMYAGPLCDDDPAS